ncbi:PEGA domain-containing protein [Myxococcota bacterium]|nr:PEGA domain-containing protein [Myxococcota bacterium]
MKYFIHFSWFLYGFWLIIPIHVHAQSDQDCRTKFSQKDYQGSADCFERLLQAHPTQASHLYNQARVFVIWAKTLPPQEAAKACFLRRQALQRYQRYEKLVSGDELIRIQAQIQQIQSSLELGRLTVLTTPPQAAATLQNPQATQQGRSPHAFDDICPGDYTLSLHLSGFQSISKKISILPKQKLIQSFHLVAIPKSPEPEYTLQIQSVPLGAKVTLQEGSRTQTGQTPFFFKAKKTSEIQIKLEYPGYRPQQHTVALQSNTTRSFTLEPKPPATQCVNWTPPLLVLGGAALLLGGGIITQVSADDSYRQAMQNLTKDPTWKTQYESSVTLAQVSGSLYIGAGAVAIVGGVLFFVSKKPCHPSSETVTLTTPSPETKASAHAFFSSLR